MAQLNDLGRLHQSRMSQNFDVRALALTAHADAHLVVLRSHRHPIAPRAVVTASPQPTPAPSDPSQRSSQLYFATRYVRLNAAPGQCLTFREIFVFDSSATNVALLQRANGSAAVPYHPIGPAAPQFGPAGVILSSSTPTKGVNGLIDFDDPSGAAGDGYFSVDCDGSAWWQVDLGGVANISAIVLWNYYPNGGAMNGAVLSLLNAYGSIVSATVLNAGNVQTIFPVIFAPSQSASPSVTPLPSER